MHQDRPRILLAQDGLEYPAGGNSVTAWMIQALVDHYRLHVVTYTPWSIDWVNRFCGTSLQEHQFTREMA